MELLNSIIGGLLAFITGFMGHVIAHDFCEVVPMISKKLVETAASQLPPSMRDRYSEQWCADLHDQPGTIAKLMWSMGCIICVYRMRREEVIERAQRTSFQFIVSTGDAIVVDVPTCAFTFAIIKLRTAGIRYKWVRTWVFSRPSLTNAAIYAFAAKPLMKWHQCGQPDFQKVLQLLENWSWQTTEVTKCVDGVAVEKWLRDAQSYQWHHITCSGEPMST
jgi:hypothetical protein